MTRPTSFLFSLFSAFCLILASSAHAGPFITGVDVYNGTNLVNWTSVKNAGIKFAFCKATEGVDFTDVRLHQNMTGANAVGIPIGPYHFARADSAESNPNDAKDEANDFVDAIDQYYSQPGIYLRPVLDIEYLPTPGEFTPGMTQKQYLSKWIRDFIGVVVDRLGFEPLIYANTDFAKNYFEADIAQYDLWLANYNYTPPSEPPTSTYGIWSDWAFWQYSASGSVSGISRNVDMNVFEGTIDELYEFVAVPQTPTGDFDNDGDVDGRDFLAWQRGYGTANNATRAQGDANYNGAITGLDLSVWQTQYDTPPLVAGLSVPEPSSLVVFGSLGMMAMVYRRRV